MTPLDRLQKMQDMLDAGTSRKVIAYEFGVSEVYISGIITTLGLTAPRHGLLARARKIRADVSAGMPRKTVAADHGVTEACVSRIVHGVTHPEPVCEVSQ